MLHAFDHRLVVRADHRDAQCSDYARDRRVDARIEHEVPQCQGEQDIGPVTRHAHPVEHHHRDHHARRGSKPAELYIRRVKQRDHHDRADIVDDRHGQQEQPQRCGAAIAQQAEHAHREGDVGRRRDCPAAQQFGVAADHPDIDQRRDRHARRRRQDRQAARLRGGELPLDPFALHLEPDDEEEHRHQPVVDPQVQIIELGDRGPGQFTVEQLLVFAGQRRIGREHCSGRDEDEQNARRGVADEERADGGKHEAKC